MEDMENIRLIIKISREAYEIMRYTDKTEHPTCPLSQETIVHKIAEGIPEPKNPVFKYIKKGKWVWMPIGHDLEYGKVGNWCCSECHRVLDKNVPMSFMEHVVNYSYCPYCGNTTEAIDIQSEDSD